MATIYATEIHNILSIRNISTDCDIIIFHPDKFRKFVFFLSETS